MTERGSWRESTSSSSVRSTANTRRPRNRRNGAYTPRPCLWPGVWKDTLPLRAYFATASNRGARRWSGGTALEGFFSEAISNGSEHRAVIGDDLALGGVRVPQVLRHLEDALVRDAVVVAQVLEA